MLNVRVEGARRLAEVAAEVKAAGDAGLRRELLRGLRAAAAPLPAAARESARNTLPQRGGLAEEIASSRFGVQVRTTRNPRVSVVGVGRHRMRTMDRGVLRHPVFGDRKRWVTQRINPGWWSRPMRLAAPAARAEIAAVVDRVAARIH